MEKALQTVCQQLLVLLLFVYRTNSKVTKFKCGNDMCIPNIQYCSHEDTGDELKWRCSLCEEEEWKCRDETIHPECLGYCGQLLIQKMIEESENYKNRTNSERQVLQNKYQTDIDSIMAGWNKSNGTIQELNLKLVDKDAEIAILRPVSGVLGGCFVVLVTLVVLLVVFWFCKRRRAQTREETKVLDEEKSTMLGKKCLCPDAVKCCCGFKRGTGPKEDGGKAELCLNEAKTVTEFS